MEIRIVEVSGMNKLQTLALREANRLRRTASVLKQEGRKDLQFARLMARSDNSQGRFEGLYKQHRAKRLRQIANRLEAAHMPKKMAGVAAPAGM